MKECQHCKTCYADDVNACPKDGMPTMHTIGGEPVLEGKYHLESRVGQGGMGVVYKARHQYLKTLHAIKIILPDLVGNDPQLVQRFRQEALAAAAIRHQNVVNVTDYGVAEGTMPFLVMEFVEGEDLHDYLAREKRLTPEVAFEMVSAICKGIGAAHVQGIVHRDMKPLNIMLLKDKSDLSEAVKILDFGLAKIKSGELLGSFIQAQTTGLMGSPYYMAPEQWSDDELDARSDIYSIGIMLFQMLAGDVPFKGSSIPAIMKKHLTDTPPTFAEVGVEIDPAVERVVRRTLEKDREKRTATVAELVEEFGDALGMGSHNSITVAHSQTNVPVSTLKVLTNPPKAKVYINDKAVGESKTDGWLLLEGVQSGNHNLRVSRDGYQDWESSLFCDGQPKQVIAELRAETSLTGIPQPTDATVAFQRPNDQDSSQSLSGTQGGTGSMNATVNQNFQTGSQSVIQDAPAKNWLFSPIVLAVIGITGLLLLTAIGGIGVYMSGIFSGEDPKPDKPDVNVTPTIASNTPTGDRSPVTPTKAEIVTIPGGEFMMGRTDGLPREKPEHKVNVSSFGMDKYEVTNGEYYEFARDTGYTPLPTYWEGGKPFAEEMNMPVRAVTFADAEAFARWRSKRDNVIYQLPTEEQWEYAARNGNANNLYPWGDDFKKDCAVIDKGSTAPNKVGDRPCGANKWGVEDLIGNVFEWTRSKPSLYPGNPGAEVELPEPYYMIRGGSSFHKSTGEFAITSAFRVEFKASATDKTLGFRLVRAGN